MQKHTKNYMDAHGYPDFIACECGVKATDIHHIIFRSEKPNHPMLHEAINLIALCRECHDLYHADKSTRNRIVEIRGLDKIFGADVLDK